MPRVELDEESRRLRALSMAIDYCACGCQQFVNLIGAYRRGHAIQHAAELRRRAMAGDLQAFQSMYSRGWNVQREPGVAAFGIEAEFFGMSRRSAIQHLDAVGISIQDDGYHHEVRPYWRVTNDGSVSQEGNELVSPVLASASRADREVRLAANTLRNAGGIVDRSCGLHVHHNARNASNTDLVECVGTWAVFQPTINALLPASRINASYAMPIMDPHRFVQNIAPTTSRSQFLHAIRGWGRYHAVNLTSLINHGSVEFRQHSGTLNGAKIMAWARFTKLFMSLATRGRSYDALLDAYGGLEAARRDHSIADMMAYLGAPDDLTRYYVTRAASLRNRGGRDEGEGPEPQVSIVDDGRFDGMVNPEDAGQEWCVSCNQWHTMDVDYGEPEEYDDGYDPSEDEDRPYEL